MQNLYDIEDPNPRATKLMDSEIILEEILIEEINKVRASLPKSLTLLERIEALKMYNIYGTTSKVNIARIRRNQRILRHRGIKNIYHYHAKLADYSYLTEEEILQWKIHTDFNQRVLQIRHLFRKSLKTRFFESKYSTIITKLYEEICLLDKYTSENKYIRKFWAVLAKELYRQLTESSK